MCEEMNFADPIKNRFQLKFPLTMTFAATTASVADDNRQFRPKSHIFVFLLIFFSTIPSMNFHGRYAVAAGCVYFSQFDLLSGARLTLTLFGRMR